MHRTSRAERLTTSVCDSTTTPQPFLYPERRLQPVAGRRHAPWTEIVRLPTRYMYFLFFCALLSLCFACLSNAIFFLGILFLGNGASFYDSPVCRKASSPGPEGLTLGQQYNVGEKPTAILYTYINSKYFIFKLEVW